MLSLRKYMTLSVVAASAVIYHAFATRRQFFPTTVYLSTSKLAVAAVGNLSFAMALCMYNLVIKIFLGTLREIELERVKEKLSSAIMETCLALTIFREEFNIGFVGMFTVLTFVKVFHWLVEDRVDYIEVTPSVSRLAHVRIVSFLMVLLGMDVLFLHHTIAATLDQKGHSVQLLFAFEYIILASTAAATLLKYLLSMLDAAMEGRWEGKGTYVFYLELLKDMMHLFVYCIFFVIVFSNYGLPLHLIRDLYMTFRNFKARIADFLRFRQVTARMDRFPDATVQDLARCDGICIICREEMAQQGLNKKLHCGHVFHLHCLRSWLERQQNCPTCRMSVFRPPPASVPPAAAADEGAAAAAAPEAAAAGDAGAAGAGAAGEAVPGAAAAAAAAVAAARGAPGLGAGPPAPAVPAPRPPSRSGRTSAGGHRSPGAAAGAAGVPPAAAAAGTSAAGAAAAAGALGGGLPAFQSGAGPSSSRRERGGEGSSSRSSLRRGGSGAAAAAAAAGPGGGVGDAPAAGIPAGYWPGNGAAAGLMWQMPQWYPVTSMAAFTNTPLQYAGQQSAVDQAQALAAASMVPMVPAMIPAISAPFSAVLSPPVSMAPNATPEQAQAAAAAAMAAAAAAAMYMPPMMPGLALMPPAMLPGGAAPGSAQEQMAAAAAANAAAAAAAAVMGGAATPEVMQASFEATQQMLQRQLDYLQSQMSRIRSNGGADAAAAAAAGTSAPAPAAPPVPASTSAAPAAAAAATAAAAGAPASLAAALQQPEQAAAAGGAGPSGIPQPEQPGPSAAPAAAPAKAASSSEAAEQPQQAGSGAGPSQAGEEAGAETADELRRRRLQRFGADA